MVPVFPNRAVYQWTKSYIETERERERDRERESERDIMMRETELDSAYTCTQAQRNATQLNNAHVSCRRRLHRHRQAYSH